MEGMKIKVPETLQMYPGERDSNKNRERDRKRGKYSLHLMLEIIGVDIIASSNIVVWISIIEGVILMNSRANAIRLAHRRWRLILWWNWGGLSLTRTRLLHLLLRL